MEDKRSDLFDVSIVEEKLKKCEESFGSDWTQWGDPGIDQEDR